MLKFQIDADKIAAQFKEFALEVKQDLQKSMQNLATLTRTRIVEFADKDPEDQQRQGMSSPTKQTYMENLSDVEEIAPGVYVISLDQDALWIEEGTEKRDMKPALLDGRRYRIIPFKYDRPQSKNSNFTNQMISQIRQTLRKDKISISKIEYNADGSPRTGKLHEYNLGGPRPGKGNTPALDRLSVYQKLNQDTGKVTRSVMTFRTVKADQEGKWIHPGYKARKLMDKAMNQAQKDWDEKILPEIMKRWGGP